MSKCSLCALGVCMTITGVVLAVARDGLALALLAIAALCFALCRFSRIPKFCKKDWFMACTILILAPIGFFLVTANETYESQFWMGLSFVLEIPILFIFANVGRESAEAEEAKRKEAELQEQAESKAAEKPTEPVKEIKQEAPEKAPEHTDTSTKEAETPETGGAAMQEYLHKATKLIAKEFQWLGLKFDVRQVGNFEALEAGFTVRNGPNIKVLFISGDDKNAVHVTFNVVSNISRDKRGRMLEACNLLNHRARYFKFYLQNDAVGVDYDFLSNTPDEALGKLAGELFIRISRIMDEQYGVFMKALYTDEEITLQPHEEKKNEQPAPWRSVSTEMLMTSQFPALYMTEKIPAYHDIYITKLVGIGFSESNAEKMFQFESDVIRRHNKQYLQDLHFTASWYFSLVHPFFTEYPKTKEDILKEKYFTISEICKMIDEAEWHFWNSHEKNPPDAVWEEICAWRLKGPGMEFASAYFQMIEQETGIPRENIGSLCALQGEHLNKYKWK